MERKITCIICPRGCAMTATVTNGAVSVSGYTCPKGEEYAINECTNPVRTVTATVRVANRKDTMVSVKTAEPVPKDKMMDVMNRLREIQVNAPLTIGEILVKSAFGTDIVVTKAVD